VAWLRERRVFRDRLPSILTQHEWVFIVGCNNSGTTLIHDVLAASNGFSHMAHEGHRYTNVLRRARRRGHERVWTEYLDDLRLEETDPIDRIDRLVFDWLKEIEPPVRARILEKTPANAVRMTWLQRALPNSSFIGVVRNGYAVVEGIRRKGRKPVERGARHWARVNEIMTEDSKKLHRFLLVRYEDFVASSEDTLGRLATFLRIPVTDLRSGFDKVSREPTQSLRVSIQDMNAASMARLDPVELATIKRHAAPMLSKYGYE
jgi:hypothetical protein